MTRDLPTPSHGPTGLVAQRGVVDEVQAWRTVRQEVQKANGGLPDRVDIRPEAVEQGLAKLVLTLLELVRRLLEKQGLRRMESGDLSDEEIERLGLTFMNLEARMEELKRTFGLEDEDLNLDLGPLGRLM